MTKVLVLTKFDMLGASSRVRCHQYYSSLEEKGFEFTVLPLISNDMLRRKYVSKSYGKIELLSSFLRRIISSFSINKYDVVWIQKEIFPFVPFIFDRLYLNKGVRTVIDLDDAEFIKYQHGSRLKRFLLADKYKKIFNSVDNIVVGNSFLRESIKDMGVAATPITIIPSVVDTEQYTLNKSAREFDEKIVLGWMGTPYTEKYMHPVIDYFEKTDRQNKFVFKFVGASDKYADRDNVVVVPWSEATEVQELNTFDIGLMPLHDDQFERGKCGYKAIQYMSCGLPVIVSPVGVNCEIVEDGVNGYYAYELEDWYTHAKQLSNANIGLSSMVSANIEKIKRSYSISSQIRKISEVLRP